MSLLMVTSTRAATLSGRSMTRSSTLILRARRHREFSSLMISCLEKVLSKNFHSFLSTLGIRISSSKSMAMLDCQGHTGQLMDLLSQPQASLKPFTSQSKSLTKSLQSILTTLENLRSSLVAMTFQIYHLHQPWLSWRQITTHFGSSQSTDSVLEKSQLSQMERKLLSTLSNMMQS